jgi:hypothetical protein
MQVSSVKVNHGVCEATPLIRQLFASLNKIMKSDNVFFGVFSSIY